MLFRSVWAAAGELDEGAAGQAGRRQPRRGVRADRRVRPDVDPGFDDIRGVRREARALPRRAPVIPRPAMWRKVDASFVCPAPRRGQFQPVSWRLGSFRRFPGSGRGGVWLEFDLKRSFFEHFENLLVRDILSCSHEITRQKVSFFSQCVNTQS